MSVHIADIYHFHATFSNLNLSLGSQGKPVNCILGHNFQLIRMKFCVVIKQFKLNILTLLLSEIYWRREITADQHCVNKKKSHWHALGHLWTDFGHTTYDHRYYSTLHFYTRLSDLITIQSQRVMRKQKHQCQLSLKDFKGSESKMVWYWDCLVQWT